MQSVRTWVEENFSQIREDLFSLLRFKTISADSAFRSEQERCVAWLKEKFHQFGISAQIVQTSGNPLLLAEDCQAGSHAPTLLIYGHYDVQPVDPIELWHTDPFEPVEQGGSIFARGACDDKGQIFYAMAALFAMKKTRPHLPINVKFCIEGEEESGSQGLQHSLPSLKKLLQADSLLIVDFDLFDRMTPAINLGARGMISGEISLRGSKADLHSGIFGGIAYNPNRALVELLARCWDEEGRIQIPHFYDDVAVPSEEELRFFAGAFKEDDVRAEGIGAFANQNGLTFQEASWFYPTIEINGMSGGYTGVGFKTVIPAEAKAKISCRLVPHQDPQRIASLVSDFLRSHVEKGIEIKVDFHGDGKAYRGKSDSALAIATERALETIFRQPCKRTLAGGSIPVIAEMIHQLQIDVVGMGMALPSDHIHSPNESFGVDRFKQGLFAIAQIIDDLGKK